MTVKGWITLALAGFMGVMSSVTHADEEDIRVEVKDGKVVILQNGEEKEIDLDVDVKGDGKAQVQGKIMMVGPDGKVKEFNFGEDFKPEKAFGFAIPGQAAQFMPVFGKYMIGVDCRPVSPTLRAQLHIDEGTGLSVSHVADDSPAAEAGLKQHDVIVDVNGKDVASLQALSKMVQAAGKAEKSIKLKIMRGGKKETLEVTPSERKGPGARIAWEQFIPDDAGIDQAEMRKMVEGMMKNRGAGEFRLEKVLPGGRSRIRLRREENEQTGDKLDKRFENLSKQVEELKKTLKQLQDSIDSEK